MKYYFLEVSFLTLAFSLFLGKVKNIKYNDIVK